MPAGGATGGCSCCGIAADGGVGDALRSSFGFGVWNSTTHSLQLQEPSGGEVSAGDKQYMW